MLSKNFKREEFQCQCGCGYDDVDMKLVEVLQQLRDELGCPITITSACRCEEHNANVGGSPKSQHLLGTASDIVVKGCTPKFVQQHLKEKYPDSLGIGCYNNFTHVDVREGKARW